MESISQIMLRVGYNFFIDGVVYYVPNGITAWYDFIFSSYANGHSLDKYNFDGYVTNGSQSLYKDAECNNIVYVYNM